VKYSTLEYKSQTQIRLPCRNDRPPVKFPRTKSTKLRMSRSAAHIPRVVASKIGPILILAILVSSYRIDRALRLRSRNLRMAVEMSESQWRRWLKGETLPPALSSASQESRSLTSTKSLDPNVEIARKKSRGSAW
jgi:hypothetical protein